MPPRARRRRDGTDRRRRRGRRKLCCRCSTIAVAAASVDKQQANPAKDDGCLLHSSYLLLPLKEESQSGSARPAPTGQGPDGPSHSTPSGDGPAAKSHPGKVSPLPTEPPISQPRPTPITPDSACISRSAVTVRLGRSLRKGGSLLPGRSPRR